jgi:hydroxyacylglutathione hydrolase
MLFERIESVGLAHYSYIIGDGTTAFVIDPRRDCDVYIQAATQEGMRIAAILETHRNEDYVTGSLELAARTGAEIWHADTQLDYGYGQPVEDGQTWQVGRLKMQAIHSPGHTPGSMSYLLFEPSGAPWMVFSGDALFAGDVGRVDFLGMDRAPEMAGHLYDTIFNKLLPLGDDVILCPAHGFGSACGGAIAERNWTTLGLERKLNPRLQFTERDAFIANVAKKLEKPPYFERMEKWNAAGAPILGTLPVPTPLSPSEFAEKARQGIVLDTRMELGFGAAHVPGALSVWLDGVSKFAGWFLPNDRPILLVNETPDPTQVVRHLIRIGYDDVVGSLAGGMLAWHMAGQESASLRTITVQTLCHALDEGGEPWILDVRSDKEVAAGPIPDAHHIHLTQLPHHLGEVPRDRPVHIFCGSGLRSMVAASLLRREGADNKHPWENLAVVLGGLSGWSSTTCPLEL